MRRSWTRMGLLLALLPFVAVACDDGAGPTTTGETAQLSLLLTDDPGVQVDSVWVEIGDIYLQGLEGDEEDGGRVPVFTAEEGDELGLVNLARLDDETLTLTEDFEVPAGTYGQLRFVVESAVLKAGDAYYSLNGAVPPSWDESEEADGPFMPNGELKCPSCQQSGLKVLLPQDVFPLESGQHVYVIDFDIARSFGQQAGRSGKWVMHPVMVATELGFTGSVDGTVALAEGVSIPMCPADDPDADPPVEGEEWDITVFQAVATAQNLLDDPEAPDPEPLTYTASPDTGGSLSFGYLAPDMYDMGFATPVEVSDTHQIAFEATVDPETINVTSGSESSVSYTITSATCQEIPDTNGGS